MPRLHLQVSKERARSVCLLDHSRSHNIPQDRKTPLLVGLCLCNPTCETHRESSTIRQSHVIQANETPTGLEWQLIIWYDPLRKRHVNAPAIKNVMKRVSTALNVF